jgi:hypothetical protein
MFFLRQKISFILSFFLSFLLCPSYLISRRPFGRLMGAPLICVAFAITDFAFSITDDGSAHHGPDRYSLYTEN